MTDPNPAPEYASEREAIEAAVDALWRKHKLDDRAHAVDVITEYLARVRPAAPEQPAQPSASVEDLINGHNLQWLAERVTMDGGKRLALALLADYENLPPKDRLPIPMVLHCPECRARHVDVGEFATKQHHTHACQSCGMVWRPAIGPTVGVQFLPGFKNEEPEQSAQPSADACDGGIASRVVNVRCIACDRSLVGDPCCDTKCEKLGGLCGLRPLVALKDAVRGTPPAHAAEQPAQAMAADADGLTIADQIVSKITDEYGDEAWIGSNYSAGQDLRVEIANAIDNLCTQLAAVEAERDRLTAERDSYADDHAELNLAWDATAVAGQVRGLGVTLPDIITELRAERDAARAAEHPAVAVLRELVQAADEVLDVHGDPASIAREAEVRERARALLAGSGEVKP